MLKNGTPPPKTNMAGWKAPSLIGDTFKKLVVFPASHVRFPGGVDVECGTFAFLSWLKKIMSVTWIYPPLGSSGKLEVGLVTGICRGLNM